MDELLVLRKFIIIKRVKFWTNIENIFTRYYGACFILRKHDVYSFLEDIVSIREDRLLPIKRKYRMFKVDLACEVPHSRDSDDWSWREYFDGKVIHESTIDEWTLFWSLWRKCSWYPDRGSNCMGKKSFSKYDSLTRIDIRSSDPKRDIHICESLAFENLIQEFLYLDSFYQPFFHIKVDKLEPFDRIKDFFHLIWGLPESRKCRDDRSHTCTWKCYRNFLELF